MDSQLMKFVNGEQRPARQDKALVAKSRQVFDEVRFGGLKADGVVALAAHSMQAVVGLDATRRELADGDPILGQMLAELEVSAIQKIKNINRGLFNEWGL